MPKMIAPKVLSWASVLEDVAHDQAAKAASLPFVTGHVALMPDAHWGKGATIGSVIPTQGAIVPAAVGLDIGCGVTSAETRLDASTLPDDLRPLLRAIEQAIPAGLNRGHDGVEVASNALVHLGMPHTPLDPALTRLAIDQYGTLGSGNHFLEVCLDERNRVWLLLHSGSRGIGAKLARRHMDKAKKLMAQWFVALPDPDLAYLVQGTQEFTAYIEDLMWAQRYAKASRLRMMTVALDLLAYAVSPGISGSSIRMEVIDNHHNYVAQERHHGKTLWITRKGAILASEGTLGVVPGSMATGSYIVRGKGHRASYDSCAHGAGRAMSRRAARERFTGASLTAEMGSRTWLSDRAEALVDEAPGAYKPIAQVMADQADLCEVVHELRSVLNYKGTL